MTVDSIAFGEAPGKAPWCRLKPALLLEQNVLGKNAVLTSLHVFCFCSPHRLDCDGNSACASCSGLPGNQLLPQTSNAKCCNSRFQNSTGQAALRFHSRLQAGAQQPRSNEEDLERGKWDVKSVKNVKRLRGPFLGIEREKEPPEPFDTFDAPVQTQTENPRKA